MENKYLFLPCNFCSKIFLSNNPEQIKNHMHQKRNEDKSARKPRSFTIVSAVLCIRCDESSKRQMKTLWRQDNLK